MCNGRWCVSQQDAVALSNSHSSYGVHYDQNNMAGKYKRLYHTLGKVRAYKYALTRVL